MHVARRQIEMIQRKKSKLLFKWRRALCFFFSIDRAHFIWRQAFFNLNLFMKIELEDLFGWGRAIKRHQFFFASSLHLLKWHVLSHNICAELCRAVCCHSMFPCTARINGRIRRSNENLSPSKSYRLDWLACSTINTYHTYFFQISSSTESPFENKQWKYAVNGKYSI